MTTDERIAKALESIANSLSTLAEDTKANKELKETLITNVNSMQKAIELVQGLSTSKTTSQSNTSSYQPRQLFKKFED